jgi:hypothetical protein
MKKQIIYKILLIAFFLVAVMLSGSHAGVVTKIEWDAVTANSDGTPCDDLAGYKIYCSNMQPPTYGLGQDLGNVITVLLSAITAFSADGVYTCVATALDVWGNESAYSNSVKTLKKGTSFFGSDSLKPGAPQNVHQR